MSGFVVRVVLVALLLLFALVQPSTVNLPARSTPRGPSDTDLYVSPDGHADAPGTRDAPLTLAAALAGDGPAQPGNTVWLREGTYRGAFVSAVRGLPDAPIVFRQYPGERAIIDSRPFPDAALTVTGAWTTFWGFEITNSDPERQARESGPWPADLRRGSGIFARGPHNAFINLVVHDLANGFGVWEESQDSVVYGNLVYYNGWEGPERAHGHGIYTQNRLGQRLVADNIVFRQFSHGIHAFGSSAAHLDNITLRGNAVFDNGGIAKSGSERDILLGGDRIAANPVLEANATFGPAQSAMGWDAGCTNGRVFGNTFVGTTPLILVRCDPSMTGNTFVGFTGDVSARYAGGAGDLSRLHPDNTFFATAPADGVHTQLRVNDYDPSRAHLIVYNWGARASVDVDVREFARAGDRIDVIDAQNYFGRPVASVVHRDGQPLTVPMTSTVVATPIGAVPTPPRHTGPRFGVFVLRATPPAPRP
ncbi:MAG: right-handed parallel beta-helix repeat-containing protein [Acidobacteria bacterium]|nr:right-handed parallel beta-helix repeat-containing protein [Acidobacteriota bacterium]